MPYIKKEFGQLPWEFKPEKRAQWSRDSEEVSQYHTSRWRKLRQIHLNKNPYCVICKTKGIIKMGSVVDHIIQVSKGGDFWRSENHQTLCKSHHNEKSARERHGK